VDQWAGGTGWNPDVRVERADRCWRAFFKIFGAARLG
jgi:hypothetical protein